LKGLDRDGTGRRTWQSSRKRYYEPSEIFEIIHRNEWPYKTRSDFYHLRDRALASLEYLLSGRVNEILAVVKSQFREDEDDPDFLVCRDFWVSKRWRGGMKSKIRPVFDETGRITNYRLVEVYVPPSDHPTPDIPLPRVGKLSPFTAIVEKYLEDFD